jgi:hypothetical protein
MPRSRPVAEFWNPAGALRTSATTAERQGNRHVIMYDHVVGADRHAHAAWKGAFDWHSTFHEPLVVFGYLAGIRSMIGPGEGRTPMSQFKRKTVVISGAARGQHRSHALRFAEEGPSVVHGLVLLDDAPTNPVGYPSNTAARLREAAIGRSGLNLDGSVKAKSAIAVKSCELRSVIMLISRLRPTATVRNTSRRLSVTVS